MLKRAMSLTTAIFALTLSAEIASANTLTYSFTGTLMDRQYYPNNFDISQFGTTVTGSWIVDSAAAGSPTSSGGTGYGLTVISGAAGGYGFSAGQDEYNTFDMYANDLQVYGERSLTGNAVGPYAFYGVAIYLSSSSTLFPSGDLPLSLPDLSAFDIGHQLVLSFAGHPPTDWYFVDVYYQVTSVSVTSSDTPEPSTVVLASPVSLKPI